MKILLLCEPRSGSTNLGRWFHFQNIFDVRWESAAVGSVDYVRGGIKNLIQKPDKKHIVLKEIYYGRLGKIRLNWEEYLDWADKIVFLHREDGHDQAISWNHAMITGNFCSSYPSDDGVQLLDMHMKSFKHQKKTFAEFREKFAARGLTISYEDLYMRDKIHILIEYLGLKNELNRKFPEGQKLRYYKGKNTRLI